MSSPAAESFSRARVANAPQKGFQTSPLNTDVPPMIERIMPTPQAATREELEDQWDGKRRRSSSSLEGKHLDLTWVIKLCNC